MNGTSARRQQKLLRLGLGAGAASIGAVAVSLLIGGTAASAAEDQPGGLSSGLGSASALVSESVLDAVAAPAPAAPAPVETLAAPVVAPVVQAVVAGPAEAAAPVVRAVVAGPVAAAQPIVEEAAQPVAAPLALPPVLELLAPAAEAVESLVETVADDVVTPIVATLPEVDGTVDVLPIVEEVLDGEPLGDVLAGEPLGDVLLPIVEGAPSAVVASEGAVAGDVAFAAEESALRLDAVEASALAAAREAVATAGSSVATASPPAADVTLPATDPPPGERIRPHSKAVVPVGAAGSGAAPGDPAAYTHAHFLPAPTGGMNGAVDDDRGPASPVEEHTARPD